MLLLRKTRLLNFWVCIFDNMALYFESRINKYALLQTVFGKFFHYFYNNVKTSFMNIKTFLNIFVMYF